MTNKFGDSLFINTHFELRMTDTISHVSNYICFSSLAVFLTERRFQGFELTNGR